MEAMHWWQKAVFYQIYPRSFADGNGDGIGDFHGMISKLDYLKDLGIDAIWLSPHYPSPMVDCGYDISSYVDVAPEYGTLADFRRFLDEAHQRDIRLVLDLVLNHTSDQHTWFLESRSSRNNPKRDWYIWRDGKNKGLPNNWFSTFGGPAWTFDEATQQYYYHFFFKEQPDLNWRNQQVKEAMWNEARFWLDMGVDGFRLDAIGTIFEDPSLTDQNVNLTLDELQQVMRLAKTPAEKVAAKIVYEEMFQYQHDLPGMHDLMRELRAVMDEYPEKVLIGETDEISYYGSGSDELNLIFNFPLMRTDHLTPAWVRANQALRLGLLPSGAWPCNTLGNHDSPRVYSHFGDGVHNAQQARLHLALILTLKGTPFLYYGEEIGMSDYLFTDLNRFRDPLSLRAYQQDIDLMNASPEEALIYAAISGRDKNRTPFQWGNQANAGFSPKNVETWLPVNPDYDLGVNYAEQAANEGSLFHFYKTLLQVRKQCPALNQGEYQPLNGEEDQTLAFYRIIPEQKILVALNFTDQEEQVQIDFPVGKLRRLFSSDSGRSVQEPGARLHLAPFEVYIGEVQQKKTRGLSTRAFRCLKFPVL